MKRLKGSKDSKAHIDQQKPLPDLIHHEATNPAKKTQKPSDVAFSASSLACSKRWMRACTRASASAEANK